MSTLTLADLDPAGHTSFSFYDLLPGRGLRVEGAPDASSAASRVDALARQDLMAASDGEIDELAALLVTHGAELAAGDSYRRLADAAARAFASLIGDEVRRPRRMRLTRLGLMLRVLLDREEDTSIVSGEIDLPGKSPWDWLAFDARAMTGWLVTCDHDNLRWLDGGHVLWSARMGLPTQLDRLRDATWVGSHYSNGGCILQGGPAPQVTWIEADTPLVLAFESGARQLVIDAEGRIHDLEETGLGPLRLQLPARIHRARMVGGRLQAFDWGQAGVRFEIDPVTLEWRKCGTGDIIVCNDACESGGFVYGICKLQGRVFKMDAQWQPVATRLGAGAGAGQLLDPIMIRADAGTLSVINWFSGRLLQLPVF